MTRRIGTDPNGWPGPGDLADQPPWADEPDDDDEEGDE